MAALRPPIFGNAYNPGGNAYNLMMNQPINNPGAMIQGQVMANAAAARGAAMLQQQQPQRMPPQQQGGGQPPMPPQAAGADPRTLVAARRQKKSEVTEKITGNAPVLPAKRKPVFIQQQLQMQQQLVMQQQLAMLAAQQAANPVELMDPVERREHEATVDAIKRELESTAIHMQVLERRQQSLRKRLSSMGVRLEEEEEQPPDEQEEGFY